MSTQPEVERHSPLPWTVEPPQVPSGLTHIYAIDPHAAGDPGDYVTVADYVNPDDAAFIVRAVNSHAELVQALEQCSFALGKLVPSGDFSDANWWALDAAVAALAKAKPQQASHA